MATAVKTEDPDVLLQWRDAETAGRRRGRPVVEPVGPLRFAFYGRLSTKEHQDCDTSRRWQLECAGDVIARAAQIVAEYFDVGFSRRRPWPKRPQASELLAAVTGGSCPFDAVVVGEYERAFCGRQVSPSPLCCTSTRCSCGCPKLLGR